MNVGTSGSEGERSSVVIARAPRELAVKSDVFIENFKFGDLARYALDYDGIRQINPRNV